MLKALTEIWTEKEEVGELNFFFNKDLNDITAEMLVFISQIDHCPKHGYQVLTLVNAVVNSYNYINMKFMIQPTDRDNQDNSNYRLQLLKILIDNFEYKDVPEMFRRKYAPVE